MRKFFQVILGAALLSTVALAAAPDDTYQVKYVANLGSGDSYINLTNVGNFGTNVTIGGHDRNDWICANVYTFDKHQELLACCACPLSPNSIKTLSARTDLNANTLTGQTPPELTIGIVATADPGAGTCEAAAVNLPPTTGTVAGDLVSGLRAWGTTIHQAPGGGFATTETEFAFAGPPSNAELTKMVSYCAFIEADGTTQGICNSCTPGAQGAQKQ